MSYAKVLKTDMKVRSIILRCFRLLPSVFIVSLKLGTLFVALNALAVCSAYLLHNVFSECFYLKLVFLSVVFLADTVLFYVSVKMINDCAVSVKQNMFSSVKAVLKLFFPVLTATLLIVLFAYFIISPYFYLDGAAQRYYLVLGKIIYFIFIPYIMFLPLKILEGKNVYDAFSGSYNLVGKYWFKYALLFVCSFLAVSFFVLLLIAGPASALSVDYFLAASKFKAVIIANIPCTLKLAAFKQIIALYGIKTSIIISLMIFYGYAIVTGMNIFNLILSVSYKTLKNYALMGNISISDTSKSKQDDDFDVENLLKDAKEVNIDTDTGDTFDDNTSALGHQDRAETLRHFNKEDTPEESIIQIIHEYPDPEDKQ